MSFFKLTALKNELHKVNNIIRAAYDVNIEKLINNYMSITSCNDDVIDSKPKFERNYSKNNSKAKQVISVCVRVCKRKDDGGTQFHFLS